MSDVFDPVCLLPFRLLKSCLPHRSVASATLRLALLRSAAPILRDAAMNDGVSSARSCVECGKPIVRRRTTAVYCSGKCREVHNARKRRQARQDKVTETQPVCSAVPGSAPDAER